MSQNLANERQAYAQIKRIRKAVKMTKNILNGGWGDKAKEEFLGKNPKFKEK